MDSKKANCRKIGIVLAAEFFGFGVLYEPFNELLKTLFGGERSCGRGFVAFFGS